MIKDVMGTPTPRNSRKQVMTEMDWNSYLQKHLKISFTSK
jgi:hypothetical protein